MEFPSANFRNLDTIIQVWHLISSANKHFGHFLSRFLSFCLCLFLFFFPYLHALTQSSIHPSIQPFINPSICPFVRSFILLENKKWYSHSKKRVDKKWWIVCQSKCWTVRSKSQDACRIWQCSQATMGAGYTYMLLFSKFFKFRLFLLMIAKHQNIICITEHITFHPLIQSRTNIH